MTPPLLPSVALGDNQAISACIDRYSGLVWSLARRFLRDLGTAEDAVQEIFVEIWKVASRFDPDKGSEVAFIATLTRRRLIDRVRRQVRRPEDHTIVEEPEATEWLPEQELAGREDLERAKQLVASLQPQQREAVELSLYHGLTHNEVSTRMEIPLGTAKSLIRRGLDQIRSRVATNTASLPSPS
ncbi:MAG: sigma-70 family RNA polymerase sigma factor [Planctomycetes bacterium]|nr:sigma-70 family RNA polymerase sigma factor [Planctomycetota bacterium]MCP4770687.1 sigma-70 family RNA polymerase sigma factor [Planctomycetota bacterium]MCP4860570.1 sigma-70 family RNA polymerase sigma factor [Planctomycetota bacterium]